MYKKLNIKIEKLKLKFNHVEKECPKLYIYIYIQHIELMNNFEFSYKYI